MPKRIPPATPTEKINYQSEHLGEKEFKKYCEKSSFLFSEYK
jgi:hypothetical protein